MPHLQMNPAPLRAGSPAVPRHRGPLMTAALTLVLALTLFGAGAMAAQPVTARAAAGQPDRATIKAAQRALKVEADGVIGPQTRKAVRAFQHKRGLEADGILGPQTLKALGVRANLRTASTTDASLLEAIAECESGGDPTRVSASGQYRGKYQFDRPTWRSVGGKGDPAEASEAEQDRRAKKLMDSRGPSAWPACSKKVGSR